MRVKDGQKIRLQINAARGGNNMILNQTGGGAKRPTQHDQVTKRAFWVAHPLQYKPHARTPSRQVRSRPLYIRGRRVARPFHWSASLGTSPGSFVRTTRAAHGTWNSAGGTGRPVCSCWCACSAHAGAPGSPTRPHPVLLRPQTG